MAQVLQLPDRTTLRHLSLRFATARTLVRAAFHCCCKKMAPNVSHLIRKPDYTQILHAPSSCPKPAKNNWNAAGNLSPVTTDKLSEQHHSVNYASRPWPWLPINRLWHDQSAHLNPHLNNNPVITQIQSNKPLTPTKRFKKQSHANPSDKLLTTQNGPSNNHRQKTIRK